MTEGDRIYSRFAPFIREYIYRHGWESLHEVQLKAAEILFDSEDNLLLSSGTASGKTEAVFFPILTQLYEQPDATGAFVLYIAPLKSLINDQYGRMRELLEDTGIPVYRWHGDVGANVKKEFLEDPRGILQITPESLESFLVRRSNDISRLFASLRYIVLDEVHAVIGADRGNQILCQICRLCRLLGRQVRRVGLSATIGDLQTAGEWLGAGSGRQTAAPAFPRTTLRWRLGMEHFYIQETAADAGGRAGRRKTTPFSPALPPACGDFVPTKDDDCAPKIDAGYEYLYDNVKNKKSLVFSNSREETEYVTATLRQIARNRQEPDVFLIHHGNLSASLREGAELAMKDKEIHAVTCATVTLELGVDIGRLERVAQLAAPYTVSAFLQRLGRSGRRGQPPEMIQVFREDMPLPNEPLPHLIPWELLRGIALVELYSKERFIEPPRIKQLPFSLAFHQTLSILAASGSMSAKRLAAQVLALPPLSHLPRETYRELLLSMLQHEYLELDEQNELLVGLKGERLIGNFHFYAVFKDSEDFTVRCGSEEIGTITSPPPVGERFALAGRVWEVLEIDMAHRLIYVQSVEGKMEISWPGDSGEVHTRILERMKEVLFEDTVYPYLQAGAAKRLEEARHTARNAGLDKQLLVPCGGFSWCMFPWLGTRAFRTLRRFLVKNAATLGISDIASEGCCYITFKATEGNAHSLMYKIKQLMEQGGIKAEELVFPAECPVQEKFDPHIPPELLRRAYAVDRLCPAEVLGRFGVRNSPRL